MGKKLKPKSKRSKRSERIQIIETVIPEEQCQPCQPMPICEEPNECDRLVCIRGRPGKDGRDGNEGDRGKRGKRGKIGPIGPIGPVGGPGMMGVPGMNGSPGPSGPAGIGPIGPQGPSGIGVPGPIGPAGRNGSNSIGPVGPQGLQGLPGGIGPIGPCCSMAGPIGPIGPSGSNGSSILTGNGAPSVSLGVPGDFYVNNVNGDYYTKGPFGWTLQGSLKGPQGNIGPIGPSASSSINSFGEMFNRNFQLINGAGAFNAIFDVVRPLFNMTVDVGKTTFTVLNTGTYNIEIYALALTEPELPNGVIILIGINGNQAPTAAAGFGQSYNQNLGNPSEANWQDQLQLSSGDTISLVIFPYGLNVTSTRVSAVNMRVTQIQ